MAFVVIAVAGFAPYMGLNGVLVRYLFPFAALYPVIGLWDEYCNGRIACRAGQQQSF